MEALDEQLRKSRKRGWLAPILVLGLIGLLTSAVLVEVFFYSDLQELLDEHAELYLFNSLLLGFVLLAFVFVGYLALKEFGSKKLRTDLIRQKITSELLEGRVTELEAVHELTSLVNSEMALSGILDAICSKALKTLGADQSSLFLYDPETDRLLCVSAWGPQSDAVKKAVVETGKSVVGWVIEHGKPLHLNRDVDESQFNGFVKKDKNISSSLCLPLSVKKETKGVLNITLFDQRKRFQESDLKLAQIFAENAAVAIDKVGLYQKLQKQTKTMKNVIRELKATQDRFVQPETLGALSNLVSGMAHDFGATLTGILDKIQAILREMGGASIPQDTRQNTLRLLRAAEQLATRGSETARHIKTFAGTYQQGSERHIEDLDINAMIEQTVKVTKPKWKDKAELRGIRIQMRTDLEELSSPAGNHSEIKDVLTSMIYNSVDALPDGGKISITTNMRGDKVEIKFADDGLGMSQEVKSRIFEPFFTTKGGEEHGHGIGLSVAHGIVSRHNGSITVESEPNAGTTFTILLPTSGGKEGKVKSEAEVAVPAVLNSEEVKQ